MALFNRKPKETGAPTNEIGAGGVVVYGQTVYGGIIAEDYNPDLRGRRAVKVYDQMRKGDAQVRATLRVVKTPIVSAQWYVEPASQDPLDVEIAEFVDWNFQNLNKTMTQFLWEALLCLDFGYYIFEKVYEYDEWTPSSRGKNFKRPVVKWRKFGPRHPRTLARWVFDEQGGVQGIYQYQLPSSGQLFIPIDKLLLFTLDEEGGNPEGLSILRSAYKHWYYKENLYKIDAIQKERHSIGVPKITLPPGFNPKDKALANEMGSNLRTNEKAHVVLPPGWELEFAELRGQLVEPLKSIEHHDVQIARNVLSQFLNIGSGGGQSGSRAVAHDMIDFFIKSQRYLADMMRGIINQYAIPQLVDYNYNVSNYPKLRVRRIGENADWRALSVAYLNMVNSGMLTPDPATEEWLRDQMDLPMPGKDVMGRDYKQRVADKSAPKQAPGAPFGNPPKNDPKAKPTDA